MQAYNSMQAYSSGPYVEEDEPFDIDAVADVTPEMIDALAKADPKCEFTPEEALRFWHRMRCERKRKRSELMARISV